MSFFMREEQTAAHLLAELFHVPEGFNVLVLKLTGSSRSPPLY
jgi:hypothetical protein